MGGNLAVTIREEDGTEHRMSRWTNPTPYFVNNMLLLQKDKDYLKNYLKTWYDMREDYLANQATGNFKHNMTSMYCDHPYLAPDEYGQLVIDYKENKILSSQGYTHLGMISCIGASLDYDDDEEYKDVEADLPLDSHWRSLCSFYEQERIRGVIFYGNKANKSVRKLYGKDLKIIEQNKACTLYDCSFIPSIDYLKKLVKCKEFTFGFFLLDMLPFETTDFGESLESIRKMKKAVLELGFELSEEEHKIWDSFRNYEEE
jgi:hypothetical protein